MIERVEDVVEQNFSVIGASGFRVGGVSRMRATMVANELRDGLLA
jgi:hypothetical protein